MYESILVGTRGQQKVKGYQEFLDATRSCHEELRTCRRIILVPIVRGFRELDLLDQIFIEDDVEDEKITELLDESQYLDDPAGLDDGYNE
eukprot:scaffold55228_cov62-Attheya_sp.AAC.12